MTNPMVSIVIPVYNGANYLREAIDSALAQDYEPFEVIVVNDGSDDNGATEAIALSYGEKIRYFKKENGGVATAVNLGIRQMKGEYFSWLSHDDLYYPNKLSVQMEALKADGDMTKIVYSDYDWMTMPERTVASVSFAGQYPQSRLTDSVFPVVYGLIHGCALLIHQSHFARVGLFDETLITTQDYDMWFRMFRHQQLIYIPTPLICGRLHPEQGSRTISCHWEEARTLFLKIAGEITEDEIRRISGHPFLFYQRISAVLYGYGMEDMGTLLEKQYVIREPAVLEDIRQKKAEFHSWFAKLKGDARKLCIFGGGMYGRQLWGILDSLSLPVDFYCDNNPQLWGTEIHGCPCIPPEELYKISADTLILAAMKHPEPVLEQLRQMDCPHVATKQLLEETFRNLIMSDEE